MKIQIKNIGPMVEAEFELGELTIICGPNNTGKTYVTYALFGFLQLWREFLKINIQSAIVEELFAKGTINLDINDFIKLSSDIVKESCTKYSNKLYKIFASNEKFFTESSFNIDIINNDTCLATSFQSETTTANNQFFLKVTKLKDDHQVTISFFIEKDQTKKIDNSIIPIMIEESIREIMFHHMFPNAFIASAERTGAAIFQRELDFARNRLLEQMRTRGKEINPLELLTKTFSDYAFPVRKNVDFIRDLGNISKEESFIAKEHPMLLNDFCEIIGGEYIITRNDELFYIPKSNKRLRLSMGESSSAVRSLLDINFYLRHQAQRGDLLMIDEPELNLHPENQRRIARLLARLVNIGIKVFITTHSDYIIKELNTLVMLNQDLPHIKHIMKSKGYKKEELISSDKLRVYMAKKISLSLSEGNGRKKTKTKFQTLVPAHIDSRLGIEARSFDTTIIDMNRMQEDILFGRTG